MSDIPHDVHLNARDGREDPRSIGALLRDLVGQLSTLFRQEIALARAEMSEKAGDVMGGIVSLATGLILSLAALIVLLDAVVYGLARAMPAWLAAIIVGVVAVIGLALVLRGRSELSAYNLIPGRTVQTVRDDAKFAKEKMK
ncbi:MAG: phage holin family protein [Alphaproteobacteria bacterium]|nr:phage holin family protein [Alphaproteobacteria bacterium]